MGGGVYETDVFVVFTENYNKTIIITITNRSKTARHNKHRLLRKSIHNLTNPPLKTQTSNPKNKIIKITLIQNYILIIKTHKNSIR